MQLIYFNINFIQLYYPQSFCHLLYFKHKLLINIITPDNTFGFDNIFMF